MKKLNKILVFLLPLGLFFGCEVEEKNPFPAASLDSAGVLRTLNVVNTEVDINDVPNSVISVEVEADDFLQNERFESVDVFVSFVDTFVDRDGSLTPTTNDDEDISRADVLVRTVSASEFMMGSNGKPFNTLSVSAQEAIDLLGLTPDLARVDGGDIFRMRLAMNLNNGETYTSTNVNGNVTGQFFNSPFRYDGNVVCGYPDTFLAGAYQMTITSPGGPFGAFAPNGEVEITASSGTARSITNIDYLGGFGFSLNFNLICGKIIAPNQASGGGVGCGGGQILMETASVLEAGIFDVNGVDDSSFTMIFNDFVADGGCGQSPYVVEITFTKL